MFNPVLLFSPLCPSSFATILMGKREQVDFTLTVFLMSCNCQRFAALPDGAVVWSPVCD